MLYISLFLHQTATKNKSLTYETSCISPYSYIKPQPSALASAPGNVVYLLIPTSNRNGPSTKKSSHWLYISLFLHQTATGGAVLHGIQGCISPYSYIKPQPKPGNESSFDCCISPYSYIKPQPLRHGLRLAMVVYLLIPTSNRNRYTRSLVICSLYISLFLHQTATLYS